MEEILKQIADTLKDTIGTYDWIVLAVSLSSVVVAIAVAVFTYKIYKRQLKLMEEQKTISDTQTKISEKQTDIMEQQNKIALFEKRYEVYNKVLNFFKIFNYNLVSYKIEVLYSEKQLFISNFYCNIKELYPTTFTFDKELLSTSNIEMLENSFAADFLLCLNMHSGLEKEIEFLFNKSIATNFKKIHEMSTPTLLMLVEPNFSSYKFDEIIMLVENYKKIDLKEIEIQLKI